ncbi:MAG: hypothetical protein KJZ58_13160 [Flavobacteriales bacterium]|nr:hypothetical protein [Flavobacteriales bacterium]
MPMTAKEVVLVARKGWSADSIYHVLATRYRVHVIFEQPPSLWKLLQWRIRRSGFITVGGQFLFRLFEVMFLLGGSARRRREILSWHGPHGSIPSTMAATTPSVNSKDCLDRIKTLSPAVVVINGTRILTRHTLDAIKVPVINVHAGITPRYRGVHGAYWALVNNDRENCGVTVHLVDEGVDTGGILKQALIHPGPKDNFATYPYLQLAAALSPLCEAVQECMDGKTRVLAGPPGSHRWFHPTLWDYLHNRIRKGVR